MGKVTSTRLPERRAAACAVLLAAVLACSACALSPQVVTLAPVPAVTGKTFGANRTIALSVVDKRERAYFGTRGGLYQTAYIEPAGDITAPIRAALAGGLAGYGFRVVATGEPADYSMLVDVGSIDYKATGSPALTTVTTSADIGVVLRAQNGEEYSGRAKVSQSKEIPLMPGARDNETLINSTVSKTLERMLTQPEILQFLTRR